MNLNSLGAARLSQASAVSAAVDAIANSSEITMAARNGGLMAQGIEGLPTLTARYDANGEPIEPTRYWRAGDRVGQYPLRGGA